MRIPGILVLVALGTTMFIAPAHAMPAGDDDDARYYVEERSFIVSPENDRRYYVPKIMVYLQGDLSGDVSVLLDGQPLETTRVQWIAPPDGFHTVDVVIDGNVVESSYFEVLTRSVSRVSAQLFEELPGKYVVPAAVGSMTPIYYRLQNVGDDPITNLTMRSRDQPDLHNVDSLQEFLRAETMSMTDEESIKFLFDFLTRQLIWANGYDNYSDGLSMPGALTISGFGLCGEHAQNLAALAILAGFPVDAVRTVSLPTHIVMEVYYDGGWHMFDASSIAYYEGPNGVLSCEDIAATGSELILDYTDQYGLTLGGAAMDDFVDDFSDPANFYYYEPDFAVGRPTTWTLEAGDVLEVFARGFGLTNVDIALGIPQANATAILTRTVERPSRNQLIEINLPYNMRSVRYKMDTTGAVGSADVQFVAVGERAVVSRIVTLPIDSQWHDLTDLIPMDTLGLTTSVSLRGLSTSVPVAKATVEIGLPVGPRSLPQIRPEERQLFLEGDGGNLDFTMEVFDRVEPIFRAELDAPDPEDLTRTLEVFNDGKALAALFAYIANESSELASGHYLDMTSDRPDVIETGPLFRRGYWGTESVLSTWAGPSRWTWDEDFVFFARSWEAHDTDIGPVTFTLWVDGQALATATVDFVARPQSTDDDDVDDDADDDAFEGDDDDAVDDNATADDDATDHDDDDAAADASDDSAGCGC